MSSKRRMVADRDQQAEKPAAVGIGQCTAEGCPALGTIRRENGAATCPVHASAAADGWPRATAVMVKHSSLWWLAREAQCSPTPDALSADLAADLLRAAKLSGVQFSDGQREIYREAKSREDRPCMLLRLAGTLVEAAITAEAVDAAGEAYTPISQGRRESRLSTAIQGLALHLSEAQ